MPKHPYTSGILLLVVVQPLPAAATPNPGSEQQSKWIRVAMLLGAFIAQAACQHAYLTCEP